MIDQNVSLKPYNTFGIDSRASYFASINSAEEALEIMRSPAFINNRQLILGGGSNILLTRDFDGFVVKNDIRGIEVISETNGLVRVRVGAGENWHRFVLWCIDHNFGGLENLSLIPGSVGASPMQNIGAYGVEIKDRFVELRAINKRSGDTEVFNKQACRFGYRESIFKNTHKDQYIITDVVYELTTDHTYNISYGAIESELERMGIESLSLKAISDAVINIRRSKLPDPAVLGNSGSFFKNPVIPSGQANELKAAYPDIPLYPAGEDHIKVAAGWLIESAGWKGKQVGNCGVHKNQALVLVNYGNATGQEVFELSEAILQSVYEQFGIPLEREVNII